MSEKETATNMLEDIQNVQKTLAKYYSEDNASYLNLVCETVPSTIYTASLLLEEAEKKIKKELDKINIQDYSGQ